MSDADGVTANHPNDDDTSGVADMVEEGAPLEPQDVTEAEADATTEGDVETEVVEEIDPLAAAQAEATERTADLQRLQAEFLNYKRRVERDRELLAENATFKALSGVIEVLDTIDLARAAGEVEGGFKAVVEQLEAAVAKAGVVRYAEPGDAFDPNLHEALTAMGTDPDVTVTTVKVVARAGYRIGERVVRVAQVLTVEPA
ncbi:nucleotide exchange factor GrpE [Nocardioides yefusunii]|uniref:Protein GrpE n=1 Tax=Nocardioides yefusunii TaxID=2500546 RepID=A0ABW1QVG3_9ACTN|nr:nucleotide exchange factor GrpE [Nocardioides yefusunii]